MPFHAAAGAQPRFVRSENHYPPSGQTLTPLARRWSVRFARSEDPAVGVFETKPDGGVAGTFLTTTGDYRFLAGDFDGRRLRLSCFDGAHAFLFDARLQEDGTLAGDFWSRDAWHETWTARPDPTAALPDTFTLTKWTGNGRVTDLAFPDLTGRSRSLSEPELSGPARLIVVFGSWCPNCHDESEYLVELDRRYGPRGLRIVGLAFEYSGDFEEDARQVRTYVTRHGINYPVLIAGVSDKEKALAALPMLDRLRAFPTTIFADASGTIRTVHTGFSGPATGEEHRKLRAEFERVIEELLAEARP
jgi:hypothetical protein